MTQAELARALKVLQQAMFAYELGDRRVSVLMLGQLAHIFDISIEDSSGIEDAEPAACFLTVCVTSSVFRSGPKRAAVSSIDHGDFIGLFGARPPVAFA